MTQESWKEVRVLQDRVAVLEKRVHELEKPKPKWSAAMKSFVDQRKLARLAADRGI